MAGSQSEHPVPPPLADPVLGARLEALKLLAGGLSDRVVVLDRDLNIIYANQAAWADSPRKDVRAKCYEAFVNRVDPCGTCPATKVFESKEVKSISCSAAGDGTVCGMHQAHALLSSRGEPASVLVLFKGMTDTGRPSAASTERSFEAGPTADKETRLGELIGQSRPMRQLFEMIRLVADSQATVLIQGESGTGKELVAKTIHTASYRRGKPFVVVDCGSLTETLLESELFGHVRGAFTGAVVNKKGLFEEADGGTMFLDEIADTTPQFQAKLLRVLQEGEIKPVGSSRGIKVDVRVISASNKDLVELVKAKTFRQDLYYRLAVLPLYLPALRDRREDIPLLVNHFATVSCRRHRQPVRKVLPEAMHALAEASWPGNVRELQHYIERAVVTTSGPELTCKDLVGIVTDSAADDLRTVARGATQQAERTRILQALRQAGGNRAQAARLLKISRAGIYNKLREYEIE